MKVLVTGGTGTVGSEVIRQLLGRGAEVRVLVRDKDGASKLPREVEPVTGDLLDPVAVEKALHGVDGLYLLNAVVPDELTQGLIPFILAQRLGVGRVVYHSVFRVEQFPDVPHFSSKHAIETALRASDVPWTIIRPNYFFQNDVQMKDLISKKGIYPNPLGSAGVSAVDVRDIAEAAAIAMTSPGHAGKTYNLVGPEPLSGPRAAQLWSEALGREVQYPGEDMDGFEAQTREQMPAWAAFDLRMMFQGYLQRGFQAEPEDVATLTALLGHPPRRYEDFVRETAAAWRT